MTFWRMLSSVLICTLNINEIQKIELVSIYFHWIDKKQWSIYLFFINLFSVNYPFKQSEGSNRLSGVNSSRLTKHLQRCTRKQACKPTTLLNVQLHPNGHLDCKWCKTWHFPITIMFHQQTPETVRANAFWQTKTQHLNRVQTTLY